MAFLITKSKGHEDLYVCIKMKEKIHSYSWSNLKDSK